MKASEVLKQAEDAMRAESKRLYGFWDGSAAGAGQLGEQCWWEAGAWKAAANLLERKRKALEELGL